MIYFIRSGDTDEIKIGKATCVADRIKGLQTSHARKLTVIRLMEGGLQQERWLHNHYADRRLTGEWFRFCETMLTIDVPDLADARVAKKSGRFQQIKDNLTESFRRNTAEFTAKQLAEQAGVSKETIENWRQGVPNAFADLVVYCREYPEFGRAVARLIVEEMDPAALKSALLQRIEENRPQQPPIQQRPITIVRAEKAIYPQPLANPPVALTRTKKQNQLLAFLKEYTADNSGVAPSFNEMQGALGVKSKSGIHKLLAGLEERGAIRRLYNRARAIEVLI